MANEIRNIAQVLRDYNGFASRFERVRKAMRENIDSNNMHAKYKDASTKAEGHALGKLMHKANKLANTTVHGEDLTTVGSYLSMLFINLHAGIAHKLEPSISYVRQQFHSKAWEPVELDDYLSGGRTAAFFTNLRLMNRLHQLHVSTTDPTQVAYYPSLRHMRERREVRTKLGRYLTAYQNELELTEPQIKAAADAYAAQMRGRTGWQVKFIEHDDPNGWINVYDSPHVDSCMQGEQAVRVYAHEHSVLRLAYVENINGEIIARCIVREAPDSRKGWLRVYPEPEAKAEGRFLLDYLRANGYENRTNLDGVLLQAIESRHGNAYVCPYLDYGSGGDQSVGLVYRHGKDYLECGLGQMQATQTNGYTEEAGPQCDDCGDHVPEDNIHYVEATGNYVCECCLDGNYTDAYGRHNYTEPIPNDDVIYCESDDNHYAREWAANHDVYECEYSGNWYHLDDLVMTREGFIHTDHAVQLDHEDSDGNDYAHPHYVADLSDGTKCHADDEARLQAELDEEEQEEV